MLLILVLLATGGTDQENDNDVRAALERRYDELANATERRDLAMFLPIRHETFHAVLPDGRIAGPMDMAEYSKQFFAGVLPPVTVRFTIRALSISADRRIAVADVFQEVSRFRDIDGQREKLTRRLYNARPGSRPGTTGG